MKTIEIPFASKSFFVHEHFNKNNNNILFLCPDEESALASYRQLLFFNDNDETSAKILFFPSLDTVPYDRISPSNEILSQRASTLTKLAQSKTPKIVITAAQNILNKLPSPTIFTNSTLYIEKGLKLNIEELSIFLVANGFTRSASAVDSSEFAVRGEIVDLVIHNGQGYRINFGWNNIESIKEFDTYSQISKKHYPT